jgi:hypothetical protein
MRLFAHCANVTYISRKGKAEGYIAADVYTAVFLFIPTTLSKPEP